VQVYAGPLKGGSRAVVLFNRHSITTQYPITNVTVTWDHLGYPSDAQATVRDLHAAKDVGVFAEAFTAGVDIHDAVMVKITPLKKEQKYEEWRPWPERHRSWPVPASNSFA
jgi:translation initiation factor IF-2